MSCGDSWPSLRPLGVIDAVGHLVRAPALSLAAASPLGFLLSFLIVPFSCSHAAWPIGWHAEPDPGHAGGPGGALPGN
jgi:hypothetical protein